MAGDVGGPDDCAVGREAAIALAWEKPRLLDAKSILLVWDSNDLNAGHEKQQAGGEWVQRTTMRVSKMSRQAPRIDGRRGR